jgi:hypothetical protein
MNTEMKALIKLIIGLVKTGIDVTTRGGMIADIEDIGKLVPLTISAFSNWNDLLTEIKALPGSAQEQDFIAFIQSEIPEITDNAKIQGILTSIVKIVGDIGGDGVNLVAAIKV